MKGSSDQKQVTIRGIVTPANWDDDGNITAVAISTALEDEYVVNSDDIGGELLELIGAEVVATGTASSPERGSKAITLKKYELLQDEEEEEEEYLDDEEFEDEEEFEYQEEQW
jgi:ABC-type sugar transport system substrate-binding protein